jgi:hypothetical protein
MWGWVKRRRMTCARDDYARCNLQKRLTVTCAALFMSGPLIQHDFCVIKQTKVSITDVSQQSVCLISLRVYRTQGHTCSLSRANRYFCRQGLESAGHTMPLSISTSVSLVCTPARITHAMAQLMIGSCTSLRMLVAIRAVHISCALCTYPVTDTCS